MSFIFLVTAGWSLTEWSCVLEESVSPSSGELAFKPFAFEERFAKEVPKDEIAELVDL
jgi:hypothetical protein